MNIGKQAKTNINSYYVILVRGIKQNIISIASVKNIRIILIINFLKYYISYSIYNLNYIYI